ncbi:hypothetical protein GQX73_g2806 [Xylaria multiplex]|uniref:Glucose-methanol-choline oxidoreductase N-terminal domain-containing protein n=1 Tax=Xylaria multiplex TaxID=323545 RepID=A0A7C8IWM4_9PEZI|nr:hypothetical protein GQX73_g2806 [Xylaria multiplex]
MNTESFDFIIAGGGTAGIALASRLSEVEHHTVLVLEAGLDHSDDPRVKIPAFYSALFGTDMDWGFKTVAQPQLKGRSLSLNQGKALGGSSVINAQVYVPPTKAILNAWAELGNVGWDWNTMGPYYTKTLTSPDTPNDLRKALGIDGWWADEMDTSGPVQLSYPGNPSHPIRQLWAETFKIKRWFMSSRVWADASVGAFSNLASVDPVSRERCHAAKAYYAPIRDRQNLQVLLNAPVDKILFADGEAQPKAIGVQYYHEGEMKTVNARKEVIICAGALQSPKLLELSGIGNAEILKQHNIEVIKDLPGVGENLQDHLVCDMTFAAVDELETVDALARQEPKALEQAMLRFTQHHDGPLTSSGIITYAYLPIMDFLEDSGLAQLARLISENRLAAGSLPENSKARKYYELVENMLLDSNKPSAAYLSAIGQNPLGSDPETGEPAPPQPGNHLTIATVLAQPLSRGTVHIVSKDLKEAPEIDPKYLSHPLDVEVFAQHVMYLKSIAKSPPLSNVLKQPLQAYPPLAHLSDLGATKRYLRSRTISMWHPAGTCSMLPEQTGGVVDSSLRVYGVSNLRVVDASIVPLLPPGNLQSTIYAVAERAADLIKEAHETKA